MRRLNLNNKNAKKDTFGITGCRGCPPYYDPLEIHEHLWKRASVINASDPTFLQWEQDPKRSSFDNRVSIDPNRQYCCICNVARPPRFQMKENSIDSMDKREISKLSDQLPETEPSREAQIVAKTLAKQKPPSESPLKYDPACYEVEDKESYMARRAAKRNQINCDIGELIEPNNTSRSVMKGCSQTRPGKRMKASIFLDKISWWLEDKDDPMTMVIQEKSDYLKTGKKKKVKFLETVTKMLERV